MIRMAASHASERPALAGRLVSIRAGMTGLWSTGRVDFDNPALVGKPLPQPVPVCRD